MIIPSVNFFSNRQLLLLAPCSCNHNKTLFLLANEKRYAIQDLPDLNDNPDDFSDPTVEAPGCTDDIYPTNTYSNDIYSRLEQWIEEDDEYTYLTAYNQMQIAPH